MPFSREAIRWGFAKETVRLTAEAAPTVYVSVDKGSEIDQKLEHLADNGMRGVKADYPPHAGMKVVEGKGVNPLRVRDISYFLNMILGAPVTTEQSVVTVQTGVNDDIDFTEDGGEAVKAALAAGSYPIGASSATAGSFCAAVKTALDAAGIGTYTVAYDASTRKFTITKDSGVFVINWNTGANKATSARALLGFNDADTASAISATSDVAVSNRAFKHVFGLPSGIQPPTYTVFADRGVSVKKYNGVASRKFSLKATPNGLIMHESDLLGLDEAAGEIGSPTWAGEGNPLGFMHATVKIGGVANTADVKEWSLSIDSAAFAKRVLSGAQTPADILAPGRMKVEGTLVVYFEDEVERAKFLANTSNTLQFLIEGDTIAGSVKETLDAQLPKIHYKAYPYGEADNMLAAQVAWEAAFDETSEKLFTLELINKVASI